MSLITLAPIGGLCNRMRALNSSLALAAEIGSRVELVWYRDGSLNCGFDELFEVPAGVVKTIDIDLHEPLGVWSRKLLIARRSRLGKHLYSQDYIFSAMIAGTDLSSEFIGKDVFVETSSAYFPTEDFSRFVPVAERSEQIRGYAGTVAEAVGVHLRRTDNEKSLRHSPVNLFVEKMEELLVAGSCGKFFLATDSPEDELFLKDIFRESIITHPKASHNRNDCAAIKDALVDLYCLAQCKMIIGSYWSSFSETAAKIGGKQLEIIKSDPVEE